jgi:hypothetical protein
MMINTLCIAALALACLLALKPGTDAGEYYPAEPGNTWTYESSVRGQFTNQVVDTVSGEGSVIFRIRSTDSSGREQMLIVRHDGPRLYLGLDLESLALLADFSLEVGASTPTRMGAEEATVTVVARHESLEVFGAPFDDVVEVHVAPGSGGGLTYYFARGVGLVGMESASPLSQVRLIEARVGGKTITAPAQN